jgi:hypothetical protein
MRDSELSRSGQTRLIDDTITPVLAVLTVKQRQLVTDYINKLVRRLAVEQPDWAELDEQEKSDRVNEELRKILAPKPH